MTATVESDPAAVENPHAGQGSAVVLDIGGTVGALVVTTPAEMEGVEVEIVPTGQRDRFAHSHEPDGHSHHHSSDGDHEHAPHVAVVLRSLPDGEVVPSLVYGELAQGRYDLYVKPDGPVRLTVDVVGAQVTEADWPTD